MRRRAPCGVYYKPSSECTVAYSLHEACSYPMSFEEEDPYGEAYTQEWPVTPSTLRVSNGRTDNVWVEVAIDGTPAGSHFLAAGRSMEIQGFRVYNEAGARGHRPFLFSMPRQMRGNEFFGAVRDKKKVASRAEVVDLLRKVDENLSAPAEDDDDVVDLTI